MNQSDEDFTFDFDSEPVAFAAASLDGSTEFSEFSIDSATATTLRPEITPSARPVYEVAVVPPASAGGSVLYIDIETIPDYERQHLFSLPSPPAVKEEQPFESLLPPAEFITQGIKEINHYLSRNNPCEQWLQAVEEAERAAGKKGNRKGLFDAIQDARESKTAFDDALRTNRKKMATTPEMAKICAMGVSIDDDQVISLVDGQDGVTETAMLELFWQLAKKAQHICGFNLIGFDLPTVFFRSILLGVPASRVIDLSPHRGQVIDLMVARFGRIPEKGFGLKNVARLYHIDVPCEGVDGSQVEELLAQNPLLVGQYVASDIVVTKKLHRLMAGFFCS